MIKFYFVDVSSIQSNVPRSNFSEDQIEQLADIILESEGVLNVILLTQTGINSYNVLAGDLEYYAAVRAKEKNPRQGEMINAVIVQPSNQDTLLKQAELFNREKVVKVIDEKSLVLGLEKQLDQLIELQNQDHKKTQAEFQTLSQMISSGNSDINNRLQQLENTVKDLTAIVNQLITQLAEKPTITPPPVAKSIDSEYSDMSLTKLKEIAKQRKIKGYSKYSSKNQNELIAILSQH